MNDLAVIDRLLTESLRPHERILLEAYELSEPTRIRLNELRRDLHQANGHEVDDITALSILRDELSYAS